MKFALFLKMSSFRISIKKNGNNSIINSNDYLITELQNVQVYISICIHFFINIILLLNRRDLMLF